MSCDMRHMNKVAIVLGGAGGIGLACSLKLLSEGARVCVVDIKSAPDEFYEFPETSLFVQGDVTDESIIVKAVSLAVQKFDRIDYLLNAVGVLWFDRDVSLLDIESDIWDRVFEINIKSLVVSIRHIVPEMRKTGSGSMVHISSIDALVGDVKAQDAYGASKAALLRLSKSIAIQLATQGIRSNAVLPGPIHTPMQKRWDEAATREQVAKSIPLKRIGKADDVASACLFLLSDEASFITGAELIVDGGIMAGA